MQKLRINGWGQDKMPQDVEEALTKALRSLKESDGVKLMSMEVWSEGRKPCKEHCWRHPVQASRVHMMATAAMGKHFDFICCKCTHGLCRTVANA